MAALAICLLGAPSMALAATGSADSAPPGIPAPPHLPAAPSGSGSSTSTVGNSTSTQATHSKAWQRALDDAGKPDLGEVLKPRPVALVIGVVWLVVVTRHQWRRRRRAASH
jgi:hypothetical protein